VYVVWNEQKLLHFPTPRLALAESGSIKRVLYRLSAELFPWEVRFGAVHRVPRCVEEEFRRCGRCHRCCGVVHMIVEEKRKERRGMQEK
jgi:hypothetical protein